MPFTQPHSQINLLLIGHCFPGRGFNKHFSQWPLTRVRVPGRAESAGCWELRRAYGSRHLGYSWVLAVTNHHTDQTGGQERTEKCAICPYCPDGWLGQSNGTEMNQRYLLTVFFLNIQHSVVITSVESSETWSKLEWKFPWQFLSSKIGLWEQHTGPHPNRDTDLSLKTNCVPLQYISSDLKFCVWNLDSPTKKA